MSAFATSANSNKGSEFEAQRSELLREIALVGFLPATHQQT
jgi:hypothetical protein